MYIEKIKQFNYVILGLIGLLAFWIGDAFTIPFSLGAGNALLLTSIITPILIFSSKLPFKKTLIALILVGFFSAFSLANVEIKYLLLVIPFTAVSFFVSKKIDFV